MRSFKFWLFPLLFIVSMLVSAAAYCWIGFKKNPEAAAQALRQLVNCRDSIKKSFTD